MRGGGSNFPLSHRLSSSPLQQSRTTVRVCDFASIVCVCVSMCLCETVCLSVCVYDPSQWLTVCLSVCISVRWVGHIVRMPNFRIPKQAFFGKLASGVGCKVVLSDATRTALRSTYEHAICLLPCCGLHPLTGVSGDSAAQMPYRLSRRGAQQLLSPNGRPGRTLLLQEGRRCGLATSAADHAPRALVCLPIASCTDNVGIRRPRRLSPLYLSVYRTRHSG